MGFKNKFCLNYLCLRILTKYWWFFKIFFTKTLIYFLILSHLIDSIFNLIKTITIKLLLANFIILRGFLIDVFIFTRVIKTLLVFGRIAFLILIIFNTYIIHNQINNIIFLYLVFIKSMSRIIWTIWRRIISFANLWLIIVYSFSILCFYFILYINIRCLLDFLFY